MLVSAIGGVGANLVELFAAHIKVYWKASIGIQFYERFRMQYNSHNL